MADNAVCVSAIIFWHFTPFKRLNRTSPRPAVMAKFSVIALKKILSWSEVPRYRYMRDELIRCSKRWWNLCKFCLPVIWSWALVLTRIRFWVLSLAKLLTVLYLLELFVADLLVLGIRSFCLKKTEMITACKKKLNRTLSFQKGGFSLVILGCIILFSGIH